MNFNKELFNTTEAREFGDIEVLKLGGHEVIIKDAREYTSEFTGNTSLKVCVDIDGNDEQKGWFQKQYDENTNEGKKWPNGATKYVSLKEEQIAYLKGFITAVEKSNNGFKFDINGKWDQLNGKKVAGVFGLEEYKDNEGKIKTATKLTQFRSLDKLSEIKIPSVKTIDGLYVEYEEYKNKAKVEDSSNEVVLIDDSDLPF